MKRAELEAKLKDVENAKEIIDFVMAENGKDITSLRADKETAITAKEDAESKLNAFKEFTPEKVEAFKAFDKTEFDELKKFKTDTETQAVISKKQTAVMELLKANKAGDKAAKLLIKGIDLKSVELDENEEVKDGAKIIEPLQKDFAEYFTTEVVGGATAGTPPPADTQKPQTMESAIADKMK